MKENNFSMFNVNFCKKKYYVVSIDDFFDICILKLLLYTSNKYIIYTWKLPWLGLWPITPPPHTQPLPPATQSHSLTCAFSPPFQLGLRPHSPLHYYSYLRLVASLLTSWVRSIFLLFLTLAEVNRCFKTFLHKKSIGPVRTGRVEHTKC